MPSLNRIGCLIWLLWVKSSDRKSGSESTTEKICTTSTKTNFSWERFMSWANTNLKSLTKNKKCPQTEIFAEIFVLDIYFVLHNSYRKHSYSAILESNEMSHMASLSRVSRQGEWLRKQSREFLHHINQNVIFLKTIHVLRDWMVLSYNKHRQNLVQKVRSEKTISNGTHLCGWNLWSTLFSIIYLSRNC